MRYRNAFRFEQSDEQDDLFKTYLKETSIKEGTQVFRLLNYMGVDVFILDDTSLMHTKTLKSIDGCVTIARCKLLGYQRVVFESGGNTGTALTAYGQNAGLETYCFLPAENISLLNSGRFASARAHLISVEAPGKVKEAAHAFANHNSLPRIPQTGWRYEASRFRGMFLAEYIAEHGGFDWFTQTISAAFGPIGIYSVLTGFQSEIGVPPRFLGIQQETNCPMFRRWKLNDDRREQDISSTRHILTKVMYDVRPHTYGTYQDLCGLLSDTKGDLTTVNHGEFAELLRKRFDGESILDICEKCGVGISRTAGDIVDKTGMIALAGTLKEIERGTIARGSKVLCG
ncbi:MAG: pyridoxal-phosphate dependent enzyme, partial [Planctomycetaceae bacterium]